MTTTKDTLPTTRSAGMMLTLGWAGFLVLATGTPSAHPATASEEGSRIPIVVLPLENRTGDPDLAFWTHAATYMVRNRLHELHALKWMPEFKATKVLKKAGLKPGTPLTAEKVRQIGQELQGRYVVWSHYNQNDAQWQITSRILETETGESSPDFTAHAAFWLDAADQVVAQILHHLNLSPTEEEQRKMNRRMTHSPTALKWAAKALAGMIEDKPAAEVEEMARKALAADPELNAIKRILGQALVIQDKFEEARKLTRQMLENEPDSHEAHYLMGAIEFKALGDLKAAEAHLKKAAQLEPTETGSFTLLGRLYAFQGKWIEAINAYEQELERDPENTFIWANLSILHKNLGQVEEARHAAGRAVKFNTGSASALRDIALAYVNLEDISKAKEYYEQLRVLAQTEPVEEWALTELTNAIHRLEPRPNPSYIPAEHPREYSANELQETLQAALTQEEAALVENPIDSTLEMKAWAWKIVGEETNAIVKAKLLFDTLDRRVRKWGEGGARTAIEVHGLWNDPDQSLSCQEYAKLYIVLARAVGLDAYYVHLDKDFQGQAVYHDCAGVFLDQGFLLADPAYRWFGVPHQKAVVMDDLQMLAHHALQGADIAHGRIALKLHPDLAWNRIRLAQALFMEDRLEEAEQELERAQALEPDRWDIHQLHGTIAMERRDWVTAESEFKKSLEANSEEPQTHVALANLQLNRLELEDAKESFLTALKYAKKRSDREAVNTVLNGLKIHQELAAAQQGNLSTESDLWQLAEAGEAEAQNTLAALLLQQSEPAYQEAIEWFRRASKQGYAEASINLARIYGYGQGVTQNKEAGHQWLLKASEQGSREAMFNLSTIYFRGEGVPADPQKGAEWGTRAADLGYAPAQFQLGLLYYEGQIVKRNYALAYQWLSLAQRSGHKKAKWLLAELTIFISKEELREGRARLEQHTPRGTDK